MSFDDALNAMLVDARREVRSFFGHDLWEADIDWDTASAQLRPEVIHALGFISGVAAAMDMTPLQLLDEVVEPKPTTFTTNRRRARSRRAL